MSVGIYFSGLYVKIYKIKSGLGQRGGDICFPLKTPSSSQYKFDMRNICTYNNKV